MIFWFLYKPLMSCMLEFMTGANTLRLAEELLGEVRAMRRNLDEMKDNLVKSGLRSRSPVSNPGDGSP